MCGVSGIVATGDRGIDPVLLGSMTDLVAYRGPDDEGFLLANLRQDARTYPSSRSLRGPTGFAPSIGLGHRRLSILDLSPAGHQPMTYGNSGCWIVYNGEVYNYVELAEELRSLGCTFASRTDTEVILAAYTVWGDPCVRRFNGMWAFAILDLPRRRLFCSRDHWGIKPFYYRWRDGVLFFGSEIKQLLLGSTPRANRKVLFDFLAVGLVQTQESFFQDVHPLPGAHCLVLDLQGGPPQVQPYYSLASQSPLGPADSPAAARQVSELLSDSVRLRLRSDVPIGSCLSGGLDSSSIVAWVSRHRQFLRAQTEQHAFTHVSTQPETDESRYADLVSKAYGVRQHLVQPTAEEVRGEVTRQIWHQDEPTIGLTTLAQWYVFKAARRCRVPVLQDGQGGDELFLGYSPYYGAVFRHLWAQGSPIQAIRLLLLSGRRSGWNLRRQLLNALYFEVPWIRAAALHRLADGWLEETFRGEHSILQTARRVRLPQDIRQMQVQEICHASLPMLLRYEDRNSMAFSVESRLPMLDPRLVELAVGLPWELKIRDGWTKHVFRLAVQDLLPAEVTWRKTKLGFDAPERHWLGHLKEDIHRLLREDLACQAIVDVPRLQRAFQRGTAHPKVLWRFFNLEHWLRLFGVSLG